MTQHRGGDAALTIDGEARILRLTLGALAALEENLGGGDFAALQKKLETPRVADLLVILQALLQGGGRAMSLDALKASDIDLGDAASAIAKAFSALEPSKAPSVSRGAADSSPVNGGAEEEASAPLPRSSRGSCREATEGASS